MAECRPSFSMARNRGNELSELAGELVLEKALGSKLMMSMLKLGWLKLQTAHHHISKHL
jgi:hypothetical protein